MRMIIPYRLAAGLVLVFGAIANEPWCGFSALAAAETDDGSGKLGERPISPWDAQETRVLKAAAEKGDRAAQADLAYRYWSGEGVERDPVVAFHWWEIAAKAGSAVAQCCVGSCYFRGSGVAKDDREAFRWTSKAAENGDRVAMYNLAKFYLDGTGTPPDVPHAVAWLKKSSSAGHLDAHKLLGFLYQGREGLTPDAKASCAYFAMAAAQEDALSQYVMGIAYETGQGVSRDHIKAVRLWLSSANLGFSGAQVQLAIMYANGIGELPQNPMESYVWLKLAARQGDKNAIGMMPNVARFPLTDAQIAEADRRIASFKPRVPLSSIPQYVFAPQESGPLAGAAFYISRRGHLVTSYHLVKGAKALRVVVPGGEPVPAKVVAQNVDGDLVILEVDGDDSRRCLPIAPSDWVRLGAAVATVGHPNIALQGIAPKVAKGEVSALSGFRDNTSLFQVSVPILPGNGGGCLVDIHGNVVGIICAVLNPRLAGNEGTVPDRVGYAVKSNVLINLVESIPGLADELPLPTRNSREFEDVVAEMEAATVLLIAE